MTQTIINLGTGGAVLNGQNGSTAGADSNDALFLDWPGDNAGNYVYLPGQPGNRLLVSHQAAFNVTDLDYRVYVAADDWTPAASQTFGGRFQTSGARSFRFTLRTDGSLEMVLSSDGTASFTIVSSAALSAVDGEPLWLRCTYDANDGSGNYEAKFYTSNDGITWSQLGVTRTGGTAALASITCPFEVGVFNFSGSPLAAKVYRAVFLDGIDGTPVLDIDTSVITSGSATSFTAVTGQTVEIWRSSSARKSVSVVSPVWLFGADDFMQVANNALLNFGASDEFTLVAVARVWNLDTTIANILSKRAGGTSTNGYAMNYGSASNSIRTILISSAATSANAQAATNGSLSVALSVMTATRMNQYVNAVSAGDGARVSGSLSNALPFRIGRFSDTGTNYADMELIAVAVLRRALSQAEIPAITAYYQARLS